MCEDKSDNDQQVLSVWRMANSDAGYGIVVSEMMKWFLSWFWTIPTHGTLWEWVAFPQMPHMHRDSHYLLPRTLQNARQRKADLSPMNGYIVCKINKMQTFAGIVCLAGDLLMQGARSLICFQPLYMLHMANAQIQCGLSRRYSAVVQVLYAWNSSLFSVYPTSSLSRSLLSHAYVWAVSRHPHTGVRIWGLQQYQAMDLGTYHEWVGKHIYTVLR